MKNKYGSQSLYNNINTKKEERKFKYTGSELKKFFVCKHIHKYVLKILKDNSNEIRKKLN